ncbi:MAG: hypothetical protein RLZZ393_589 [Pseudomonadota bacterium]
MGLCPTDSGGLVTEDHVAVPAWKAELITCGYGPAESEALESTLYVKEEALPLRRLATGLTGTLHPLPASRKLFSCQDNGVISTTAPLLIDLSGTAQALLPHAGSLRACNRVGTGEQVLVHYDEAGENNVPFSQVRIYGADGALLVEQRFEHEGSVVFVVDGKPFTAEVLVPEMPD